MSTFGTYYKVHTFGESHSKSVGVVIDGCPPRIIITERDIQNQLNRRRPGQSHITTSRNEQDLVEIHCGLEKNMTLGSPIMLLVKNKDTIKSDYSKLQNIPRPSHADYTYKIKYGINAESGGGRASARETIGRICAGAIAEKWLKECHNVEIVSWVSSIGEISCSKKFEKIPIGRELIDKTPVRCPDQKIAEQMMAYIKETKEAGNSIGGVITCVCRNVPGGLGEPVFDKLKAKLAQAMLSIPAAMGFEIGSGFEGTKLHGSEHNDLFIRSKKFFSNRAKVEVRHITTKTNHSGGLRLNGIYHFIKGVQGGISNGEEIVFRVAFKPVSTIRIPQETTDYSGNKVKLEVEGRHDPCVLPRAVPIVESMAALVLMDASLAQNSRENCAKLYYNVPKHRNSII